MVLRFAHRRSRWAAAVMTAGLTVTAAQHPTDIVVPGDVSIAASLSTRVLARDIIGYSLEPVWVSDYVNNSLAATLLQSIANVTGKAPPIRVGGNTADQTHLIMDQSVPTIQVSQPETQFNVSPAWYKSWASYFPTGTDLIYSLNFRDNSSNWANAQQQAETVHGILGEKLTMFELGNEIDHFINKKWRDRTWGISSYITQFRTLTGAIVNSTWYQAAAHSPKFQAAVFADPPWVPDQQDEIDDFDILNLTRAGLVDPSHEVIETYSVHLYPQSTCDPARWHRMRLDLLSNHTVLWLNVSQYVPQVEAADGANTTLVLGETNSVSCSGKSGISDTFGAALWSVDYVLMAASIGIQKTYFHLGARSEYSAFTPLAYELKNETVEPGIRANWYAHWFVSKVVERPVGEDLTIAALPGANSSDLSGYVIYGKQREFKKLVLLDMGVWNGTEGLGNPSTLKATDGTTFSQGTRPGYNMSVTTPWSPGQSIKVTRLQGPGTNAKSLVNVSGITFNQRSGAKQGVEVTEQIRVGEGGVVRFRLSQAEGVLLAVASNSSGGIGPPVTTPSTAANGPLGYGTGLIGMVIAMILLVELVI